MKQPPRLPHSLREKTAKFYRRWICDTNRLPVEWHPKKHPHKAYGFVTRFAVALPGTLLSLGIACWMTEFPSQVVRHKGSGDLTFEIAIATVALATLIATSLAASSEQKKLIGYITYGAGLETLAIIVMTIPQGVN